MFRAKMPWDGESSVKVRGCDNEAFRMIIVSRLYGDMELMVKQGEVSKDDLEEVGVEDILRDIFSSEQPRNSRFLSRFSNTEDEHENVKNLLDDIFEHI